MGRAEKTIQSQQSVNSVCFYFYSCKSLPILLFARDFSLSLCCLCRFFGFCCASSIPPLYIIDTRHYIWPVFLLSFPSFPCLFCCFSSLISPSLILSSLNTSNILIYLPNCSLSHLHPVSENPIKNTPAGYQPITGSRFVSGTPHFLLFQSFLSSLNSSAQP